MAMMAAPPTTNESLVNGDIQGALNPPFGLSSVLAHATLSPSGFALFRGQATMSPMLENTAPNTAMALALGFSSWNAPKTDRQSPQSDISESQTSVSSSC